MRQHPSNDIPPTRLDSVHYIPPPEDNSGGLNDAVCAESQAFQFPIMCVNGREITHYLTLWQTLACPYLVHYESLASHRLFHSPTHRGKSPAPRSAGPAMRIPAGRENRRILSLLERDDATEGDERGAGLPVGSENRKILSLLERDDATEGDERGAGLPEGRENRKILSLLDGESKMAGWDDGVRRRIGRETAAETSEALQQHWTRSGRGKLLLLRSLPKLSGGGKQLPEKRITSAKLVGTAGRE